MKMIMRLLSFFSFLLTILLTLLALLSLFESSLLKPGLLITDAKYLLILAAASFIFGNILVYLRKKIFKNSKYDY